MKESYVVNFHHNEKGLIDDPDFLVCMRNANEAIKNFKPLKEKEEKGK